MAQKKFEIQDIKMDGSHTPQYDVSYIMVYDIMTLNIKI